MQLLNILKRFSGYAQLQNKLWERSVPKTQSKLTHQLSVARKDVDGIFFVVLVPGCLHVAKRSLALIPEDIKVMLVLNGVDSFEARWVEKNFSNVPKVKTRQMVRHHVIINALLNSSHRTFGIIDYDCFVFQPNYFKQITSINKDTSMLAYFAYNNKELNLLIPETFFLYINTPVIKKLKKKYSVGADPVSWDDLPKNVCEKLGSLGLSEHVLPDTHKPNCDTLRVLMMLSLVERVPYRFLRHFNCSERHHKDLVHIGGVSHPNFFADTWKFMGSYFWRRILEIENDEALKRHYLHQYGKTSSSQLLEDNHQFRDQLAEKDWETMDRIVERLLDASN